MSRVMLGVVCGLAFGALDVAIMLPMSFPDKRAAILGSLHKSLRHWVRGWSGQPFLAGVDCRPCGRPSVESARCHHHQSLCSHPRDGGHRWNRDRIRDWPMGPLTHYPWLLTLDS